MMYDTIFIKPLSASDANMRNVKKMNFDGFRFDYRNFLSETQNG